LVGGFDPEVHGVKIRCTRRGSVMRGPVRAASFTRAGLSAGPANTISFFKRLSVDKYSYRFDSITLILFSRFPALK
jgi:hypothetical protein